MNTIATDGTRFLRVLEGLDACPHGWRGEAGNEFVELMTEVLERKAEWVRTEVGVEGVMASPADVVSEAVLVVDGPEDVPLGENVQRILSMEKPLGYVVSAVSANLSRAVLSERMGVGSRQVSGGSRPVLHFDELVSDGGEAALDRIEGEPAWRTGSPEISETTRVIHRSFVGVLAQRFQARPEVVRRGLYLAGTVAVEGDTGAGMTPATARRRISRFMGEASTLRGSLDRVQAQALAWLVFGTERHPEWSLLAECARAVHAGDAVKVSAWHARNARTVAAKTGRVARETGRQPALFPAPAAKPVAVKQSA